MSKHTKKSRSNSKEIPPKKYHKKSNEEKDEKFAQELSKNYMFRSDLLKKEFGYTNEENPFGDRNINQTLVWTKKEG